MVSDRPRLKSIVYVIAGLAGILFLGYVTPHTFSAFLTALVLAYLLNPLMKYLQSRGFDRPTALVLLYGIAVFGLFLVSFMAIPYLGHQLDTLVKSLPRYVQNVQAALQQWKAELAHRYTGEEGAWLVAQASRSLESVSREASGMGYRYLKGFLFGLFDIVLAPILVFFLLYYKQHVKDVLKRFLPLKERHQLVELGRKVLRTLDRFILAMLVDCLLVGLLTAGALFVLDVEFPVLNGLFAGFASIIPLLGVAIALVPAAFIGYAKSGDLTIIPKVCIAYFLISVILEANLIRPLIMKQTLKLNPLAVVFMVMALGELLGFWGIILAVPLTALAKICGDEVQELLAKRGGDDQVNL